MPSNIQIRAVPDDVHRALEARAAAAGKSLSDYLLDELTALARRPTFSELLERIQKREPVDVAVDSATAVREERETRR
jgi:plasmid stability protein